MSDKRYPTRMHEVLGEETGEVFTVTWNDTKKDFSLDGFGIPEDIETEDIDGLRYPASGPDVVYMVNHPERITRRPRLTEEQVDELKAAVKLGLFWLAKDENGTVSYYRDEPHRKSGGYQWFFGSSIQSLRPPQCSDVASLVSWSDPAPLDIVQVLRQNILEVEE